MNHGWQSQPTDGLNDLYMHNQLYLQSMYIYIYMCVNIYIYHYTSIPLFPACALQEFEFSAPAVPLQAAAWFCPVQLASGGQGRLGYMGPQGFHWIFVADL